jgi:hypothetical protein
MSMPGWVLSHAQAAHVVDGSLDLAACRLRREDLEHHGIHAWLDTTCWLSWNRYA